jgi:hypothetical protein
MRRIGPSFLEWDYGTTPGGLREYSQAALRLQRVQ